MAAPVVVGYALDDETVVRFEIEPSGDFRPAGPDEIVGRVREAVAPPTTRVPMSGSAGLQPTRTVTCRSGRLDRPRVSAVRWAVLSAVRLAAFALRHAAIAVANVPTIWNQGSAAVAQALTARSRSVRCLATGPRPGCS
jgi:hypothetical protein